MDRTSRTVCGFCSKRWPRLGPAGRASQLQGTLCLALHIASLQKLRQDQLTGYRELRTEEIGSGEAKRKRAPAFGGEPRFRTARYERIRQCAGGQFSVQGTRSLDFIAASSIRFSNAPSVPSRSVLQTSVATTNRALRFSLAFAVSTEVDFPWCTEARSLVRPGTLEHPRLCHRRCRRLEHDCQIFFYAVSR